MDMQNVSNLQIPEGAVRTIHDKDSRLIWGRLAYETRYAGDTVQDGTPTPDAPIPVQVVTGEQTVTVTGKNIATIGSYDISGANYTLKANYGNIKLTSATANNAFDLNAGTRVGAWLPTYGQANDYHLTGLGGTYTVSAQNFINRSTGGGNIVLQTFTNKKTNGRSIAFNAVSVTPVTVTLDSDEYIKSIYIWAPSGASVDMEMDIQLEQGYTTTTYESYQSQSYPISLDSIELCKIGDYQDYIYKSGNNWYLHKETNEFTVTSSLSLGKSGTSANNAYYYSAGFRDIDKTNMGSGNSSTSITPSFSAYFDAISARDIFGSGSIGMAFDKGSGDVVDFRVGFGLNSTVNTLALFKTWLDNNELKVYYPLANATDTQITDATLVEQLNAVHEWLTRYGYNATVTGNLPIVINKTNL